MKAGDIDYQIFADSMPPRIEQLNDMPIAIRDGAPVMLRDVAQVKDSSHTSRLSYDPRVPYVGGGPKRQ